MEPFTVLRGRVVAIPAENIDTDQIIPARYLKTVARHGLGQHLFADWRFDRSGEPAPDFPLNRPGASCAPILLAGDNFGCGSSREHAPWALVDFGFQAVISTSFADIFRNNSLKNRLLPLIVDKDTHARLVQCAAADPSLSLVIDLPAQTLSLPDGQKVTFPIDPFSKTCLVEGIDELGYLLKHEEQIAAYEARNQ